MWGLSSEWTRPDVGPNIFVFHKVTIVILSLIGIYGQSAAFRAYVENYQRVGSVVRAFGVFLVTDSLLIVIHLPQAVVALATKRIEDNQWCQCLAWGTIVQLCALQGATVMVAFATYCLVSGKPLRDRSLMILTAINYVAAVTVATAYAYQGSLGPYKNMYCNVRTDRYREGVAVTVLAYVFFAIVGATVFYTLAWRQMRTLEEKIAGQLGEETRKGSRIIMKRGALLVGCMYIWFGLHIVIGIIKGAGIRKEVPGALDVFASCIVKLMPIFDSWYLYFMIQKIAHMHNNRPQRPGGPLGTVFSILTSIVHRAAAENSRVYPTAGA